MQIEKTPTTERWRRQVSENLERGRETRRKSEAEMAIWMDGFWKGIIVMIVPVVTLLTLLLAN